MLNRASLGVMEGGGVLARFVLNGLQWANGIRKRARGEELDD